MLKFSKQNKFIKVEVNDDSQESQELFSNFYNAIPNPNRQAICQSKKYSSFMVYANITDIEELQSAVNNLSNQDDIGVQSIRNDLNKIRNTL